MSKLIVLYAISLPESTDELQYRKSLLQAKKALLNATKNELSSQTNAEINQKRKKINESLSNISAMIQTGIDTLLQMEVECFAAVNLTICGEIENGHAAFRYLLEELAEHYAQAEYLDSILKKTPQVIEVLNEQLTVVNSAISNLDREIAVASKQEVTEAIDSSTSGSADITSCPGVGQIRFMFDSQSYNVESYCNGPIENRMNCTYVEVPLNVSSRNLWDVHSCSVDTELRTFGTYNDFKKLMNSIPLKVSASLLQVNVHRSWFDPSIFENSDHFTMVS